MLYVILNWAKRMITDTCAAHIKPECTCRIIGTDGNGKYYRSTLLRSFGSDDVPPYTLHSNAPSQLHLCGLTVFIPIEFSIWRLPSSSTVLSVMYSQLHTLLLYPRNQVHFWLICIGFKVLFCFG